MESIENELIDFITMFLEQKGIYINISSEI